MSDATALNPDPIATINDTLTRYELRCQEWSGHAGDQEDNLSLPQHYGSVGGQEDLCDERWVMIMFFLAVTGSDV